MNRKKDKLIEAYKHSGEGYNPYLIGPKWQVAQLNFQPDLAPEAIKKIDVHHHTDETFLLMAGQAVLIAADMQQTSIAFEVTNMKPRVLYNIPRGCWHNIALSTDAEVLITEDANTHLGDYAFHYLNEKEQQELYRLIEPVWKK
jgi:mannose-6-phosphate isomerase-like protein (cupin superfamily)